jgi:homoserine dehydrogenase
MTKSVLLGIIGATGLVGKALVQQLEQSTLIAHEKLRVVGLASSKQMILSKTPIAQLSTTLNQLTSASAASQHQDSLIPTHLDQLVDHVLGLSNTNQTAGIPVIVDCTASEVVAKLYPTWMERGVSVVTPNKKGFSSNLVLFEKIRSLRNKAYCYHESTVGAGLPILSTLEDMIDTGDEIVQIEGILSGTLSFLFNNFSPANASQHPRNFSECVKEAKEKGYTEPDPRDDLNGVDMSRKIVILGRLSKLPLSLETLPIENIVPEPLRALATADEFMARLGEYDEHFAKMNAEAAIENKVLRYVGVINPQGKSSVELKKYPKNHPFASLAGSDNVISITTKRYPNSLVIRGAGAGAQVTAAGVFGDILKISRALN